MRILITGGTGFLGKTIINSLVENIDLVEVLNLTRSSPSLYTKKVEHFTCDLSNPRTYQAKVEAFEPEVLIHLAWDGIPDFSLENCIRNMHLSFSLIEIVTKLNSCKKIISTGSCFEYNNKIGVCNENDDVVPKDYFTFAKKAVLSFLELECNKNRITYGWARLFYVYGPNQRAGSLIPTLIETLKANKTPDLRTPKNANDFIHVNDVSLAICKMAAETFQSGIYNLGSGKSTPVLEVSKIVELALFNNDFQTKILEDRTVSSEKTTDFFADNQKSYEQFNWMPTIELQEGIKSIIKNIK